MTKEIIEYSTRELMGQGKISKTAQKFRSLRTEFINNDESQGYKVTFVDGLDDPDNDPALISEREAEKLKKERDEELKQKAKDKTLSNADTDELIQRLAELL